MITRIRILEDNWLPLSDAVMARLGWKEHDEIEIELVGDCMLLTKRNPVSKETRIEPRDR